MTILYHTEFCSYYLQHICTKNPFIQPDPITEPSSTIESIDTTENIQVPTSPEPETDTETEHPTESVPVNVTEIPTETEQPTSPESIHENNETMSHTEFASVAYETPVRYNVKNSVESYLLFCI
jgi:hypothetical protein